MMTTKFVIAILAVLFVVSTPVVSGLQCYEGMVNVTAGEEPEDVIGVVTCGDANQEYGGGVADSCANATVILGPTDILLHFACVNATSWMGMKAIYEQAGIVIQDNLCDSDLCNWDGDNSTDTTEISCYVGNVPLGMDPTGLLEMVTCNSSSTEQAGGGEPNACANATMTIPNSPVPLLTYSCINTAAWEAFKETVLGMGITIENEFQCQTDYCNFDDSYVPPVIVTPSGASSGVGSPSDVSSGSVGSPSDVSSGSAGSPSDVSSGSVGSPSDVSSGSVGSPSDVSSGSVGSPSDVSSGSVGSPSDVSSGSVGSPSDITSGDVGSPTDFTPDIADTPTNASSGAAGLHCWSGEVPVGMNPDGILIQLDCADAELNFTGGGEPDSCANATINIPTVGEFVFYGCVNAMNWEFAKMGYEQNNITISEDHVCPTDFCNWAASTPSGETPQTETPSDDLPPAPTSPLTPFDPSDNASHAGIAIAVLVAAFVALFA